MKLLKEKVQYYLTKYPELRDNDNKLMASIWNKESQATTKFDLLKDFALGKLSSPESIRRSRQKLQEVNESLRGEKYKARHKEQANVINQLNKF